ncbi:TIGR04222 domain-containing membrane protein [Pseudonocardia sp. KRD291]|uniref:TIGR04222 domain-containing membrane protein n=1 Tax=Pseudonocardia sp. KRD291 TaxID=2792007 RepID=UPI001C4A5E2E|nr:TIGR04222 domain-containing membrane protein [Pseudonocardia sp. KRD291]MBW0105307.1 TIGR04222 domain-containing membrane protein [Pseudonocardia sp. KRD291]
MTTILAAPDGGLPTTASVLWLVAYLTVAAAAVGSAVLRRRAVLRAAPPDDADTDGPDPYELAYLYGGPRLALLAALAALHVSGRVRIVDHLVSAAPPGRDVGGAAPDLLERAVLGSAATPRNGTDLAAAGPVEDALTALRDEMTGRGLLLRDEQRAAITRWRTWLVALVGVGVAGLVPAGIVGGSVGYLVLVLVALSVVAWWWGRRTVPFRPVAGDDTLARHRIEHEASSPRWEPDRTATGPTAATEVGLFGIGVLWMADPAFAGQVLPTGDPDSTDVTNAGFWNVPSHGGHIEYYPDRVPMLIAGGGG